jgi:hypothetical protein
VLLDRGNDCPAWTRGCDRTGQSGLQFRIFRNLIIDAHLSAFAIYLGNSIWCDVALRVVIWLPKYQMFLTHGDWVIRILGFWIDFGRKNLPSLTLDFFDDHSRGGYSTIDACLVCMWKEWNGFDDELWVIAAIFVRRIWHPAVELHPLGK